MTSPRANATPPRPESTPSSPSHQYQSFATRPPSSQGRPPSQSQSSADHNPVAAHNRNGSHASHASKPEPSPLPYSQLAILAVIALAEQTALNSISPYLPDMASTFPEVNEGQVGLYVGLIASSFALAQFMTNFFWGWLSDRVGRKPVVLTGTLLTATCFVAFGYCRTLWQAILVQVLMGLVNGNQGIVSTCLGEITDRSNQSKAFTYLPVIYGIGGITGPLLGGLLTFEKLPFSKGQDNPYPYLAPNLVSAAILVVDLVLTSIFLNESLEQAKNLPPLNKRVKHLFVRLWQLYGSSFEPSYLTRAKNHHRYDHVSGTDPDERAIFSSEDEDDDDEEEEEEDDEQDDSMLFLPEAAQHMRKRDILNRNSILLFATFFLFQLANIAYNSLYPIFASGAPPTGRNLSPSEIGLSLGFTGLVTIMFQIALFGNIRDKLGNKTLYRIGLSGMVVAFALMPFVGYKDTKLLLWAELGGVLVIKTVAAVTCLTSALLLITNSAPNHGVLGTMNGLAQTLSAAGRAVGPFLSGSLFTASTHLRPKGEALAFGVFAGITFLGVLLSFGIRGKKLEGGLDEETTSSLDTDTDDEDDDDDDRAESSSSDGQ